ncbi:hypothetical protein [Flavobacterium mesophilum]|uniref:hypothetical protein n=1 Tax=Flavobacterium mesophilum TaxID=3143495 RepID=UPI0031CE590E
MTRSELRNLLRSKKDRNEILGLLFFLFLVLVFLIFADNSIFHKVAFYLLLFEILLCISTIYKQYNNINRFFVLAIFVIIIFPLSHDILFQSTKGNYTFSDDYLSYTKHQTALSLQRHKTDSVLINILHDLPNHLKNMEFYQMTGKKKIIYNNGYFIIDSHISSNSLAGGGLKTPDPSIEFYNKESKKTSSLVLSSGTIKESIKERLIERENLERKYKNPKLDLHFFDIWLDSMTIFVFSNIKPIGRITQLIQLLQVIFSFFFVYMFSTFLDNFKALKITKKE